VLVAAALCPAPPLLASELTGADPVVPELRQACLEAAAALVAAAPDVIAVVGTAGQARAWEPAGRLDLTVFAPQLRARAAAPDGAPLPVSLGLGAMLLDHAGHEGQRVLRSVTEADDAGDCAALGSQLAGLAARVALLVMADGTARRTLKAPGYLDERSAPFDAQVERAVRRGDLDALLALDAGLAADLMATGRPAWQVLAGAASGLRAAAAVRFRDDPFGVFYLVASLSFQAAAEPGPGTG
jgi:hypothetical protein